MCVRAAVVDDAPTKRAARGFPSTPSNQTNNQHQHHHPPPPKKHKHQTTKLNNSARGYLLHAGICALCYASDEAVEAKLERYRDIDLQFGGSREEALLEQVARALSGGDEKAFATAVAEYDALTRLDAWKTAMLLRVKKRLAARASGEEPGGGSDEDVL